MLIGGAENKSPTELTDKSISMVCVLTDHNTSKTIQRGK